MIKLKVLFISVLLVSISIGLHSQNAPFQIHLEPLNIQGVGGLQSFAWGQSNRKWLIIGGRLDGLHQRQPFAAFDIAGHNNRLIVIDPISHQTKSISLASLPQSMQEQLSSTNMQFYQEGDMLYTIGGYGYSSSFGDHTTFAKLTVINVPATIKAILEDKPIFTYFRQISDPDFAVTGGYLNKIYDIFHLTGGQKFIGRYNPMGPDHGPGFVQEYTNADRRFTIHDEGVNLTVTKLTPIYDEARLHRRDYNVVPQIMPSGEQGITAFSGVFQQNLDLPFLDCVHIDSSGLKIETNFLQYYNHYHCAHIPMYSASENEMHAVFFGGIAQYYDFQGLLVKDDEVPFVKTIARVTRDKDGKMTEYKLPIEMPTYLGAGSEFIPAPDLAQYSNHVIKLDQFVKDTTHIGYIYGGIASTAKNIFFSNTGSQSSASSQIFKVYLIKNSTVATHDINAFNTQKMDIKIYPNPNDGEFTVKFKISRAADASITLYDLSGKILSNKKQIKLQEGENTYSDKIDIKSIQAAVLVIETEYESVSRHIIFNQK